MSSRCAIAAITVCFLTIAIAQALENEAILCEQTGSCLEPLHTVIKLEKRDDELARRIAGDHDMVVKGRVFLDSHYFVEHASPSSRSRKRSVINSLNDHPDVKWVGEQYPQRRSKRDYIIRGSKPAAEIRQKREQTTGINSDTGLPFPALPFPDPLYADQWYLTGEAVGGYDMNVREAWALGYAGRNVVVSVLDDGLQRNHPDLVDNYDPLASTDINDHDDDPTPHRSDNEWLAHGTRCAGEVAAAAGNNHCGVGVAYHAKLGGVRMLDRDNHQNIDNIFNEDKTTTPKPVAAEGVVMTTDAIEAASLSFNRDYIDIYSCSWGPNDNGEVFEKPGPLAREAFRSGATKGRGGKGNIFVFASGNGGSDNDSCSADGYTTSIYTLSISSATYYNTKPHYVEECPSLIAVTYSSAKPFELAIVTTDAPSGCTKEHGQTSASAPLASGIIALALEANPNLTWRDVQHMVIRTANPTPLLNNTGWSINGVGRRISNTFGYGLMDAGAMVKLARVWKQVPHQHTCTYESTIRASPRHFAGRYVQNFTLDVNGCTNGTAVTYLEHVQVLISAQFDNRGDLTFTLYSPAGTRSVLLPPRPKDDNSTALVNWPFLSVQSWGEDPHGTWTLEVESISTNTTLEGSFSDWTLLLYGTQEPAQPTDPVNKRDPVYSPTTGFPSDAAPVISKATDPILILTWSDVLTLRANLPVSE